MKLFVTRNRARSFGAFAYNSAKQGKLALVSYGGETFWLGYSGIRGFYLTACEAVAA